MRKVKFMDKNVLVLLGLFAIVFGGVTMLANSAEFANFPLKLTPVSAFGIILLMVGIIGIYYGTK